MKLTNLKIVNFRNHSSTELNLSKKVSLFIGPNAAGKSSVVDALAFLLTGTNARTSKSGEGMDENVTFGESRAIVSANIDNIGKVTRTIPHTFQISDWEGTMTGQLTELYNKLKINKDSTLCSIYSNRFLDMTPDEQKNFMFMFMGNKLKIDIVMGEFSTWCKGNNVERGKDIWEYIIKTFALNDSSFSGNPGKFDDIYKGIVTSRKVLKKQIKQLETMSQQVQSKLPDNITIDHKDTVLAKLGDLKGKRDELMVKLGSARQDQRRKVELEEIVAKEKTLKVPKETQENLKSNINELKKGMVAAQKQVARYESQLKNISTTVDKLGKFSGKCPLCEEIECKITKEEIQTMVSEFENKKSNLNTKTEKQLKIVDEAKEKIDKFATKLEYRVRADILLPDIEKAKKTLEELNKKNIANTITLGEDIRKLDERLTKGQTILVGIEAEISNEKRRIESKRSLEQIQKELKFSEIIAEAFGPKGLKSIMVNKAIKPLEKTANEKLKVLTSGRYSIRFGVDETNFNIWIISNGLERKLKHLSSSERLRIGIVMQDAINSLVGSKILVVDNVDMLDNTNRKLFWNLIDSIKNNYETVLVLATGTEVNSNGSDEMNVYLLGKKEGANSDLF